ncbi:MAG: Enoyl-CoA hydratase [Bacteroidetes bacterium OLB12]|nr:MAG: Enoyl-CoA hydratase [Bacteroidetes bacterium OLB12]
MPLLISSHEEFETYKGKELGVSEYLKITQAQINMFADATLDHQWIHTDLNGQKPNRSLRLPLHMVISRSRWYLICGIRLPNSGM